MARVLMLHVAIYNPKPDMVGHFRFYHLLYYVQGFPKHSAHIKSRGHLALKQCV